MNTHPKASELPRADDKLFAAIAATGDAGLAHDFAVPAQSDDAAATARTEAQGAQAEEDMRILVERKRKQRGRRRADAILGALRAMEDAGLEPHQIDGFHADCAWAIADLLHAIAGEPDRLSQARPEAEAARGSAPAGRALHPNVEGGIAESAEEIRPTTSYSDIVADSERSEAR